jgi:hypothetical protein
MQYIKTLSAIAAAALGITALITSGDASALSQSSGGLSLQKTGAQTSAGGYHRPPPNCARYWYPGCPSSIVTGTNNQTCKPNGEGCLRAK